MTLIQNNRQSMLMAWRPKLNLSAETGASQLANYAAQDSSIGRRARYGAKRTAAACVNIYWRGLVEKIYFAGISSARAP